MWQATVLILWRRTMPSSLDLVWKSDPVAISMCWIGTMQIYAAVPFSTKIQVGFIGLLLPNLRLKTGRVGLMIFLRNQIWNWCSFRKVKVIGMSARQGLFYNTGLMLTSWILRPHGIWKICSKTI